MKKGYTTGSCAQAAAKGAAMGASVGMIPQQVEILLPCGQGATFQLTDPEIWEGGAQCGVIKDAGEEQDVTHGATILARVEKAQGSGILVKGGKGVGIVTKPGLQIPVGMPAINPVPLQMIEAEVRGILGNGAGALVTISVIHGEKLAEKTFNATLGIMGGISILGTTGLVVPRSKKALKASLLCHLDVARACGHRAMVLVPGSIGQRAVLRNFSIPEELIAQAGNYQGFMLKEAVKRGFETIILAGHPGKLAKLALGHFYTHSASSPWAKEAMVQFLKEEGAPKEMLQRLEALLTTEAQVKVLQEEGMEGYLVTLAERVSQRARKYLRGKVRIGTILFDMKGQMICMSTEARSWAEGWGIS